MKLFERTKALLPTKNENGGAIPYVFAWFLGVPLSLLFLVYLFRAIFA